MKIICTISFLFLTLFYGSTQSIINEKTILIDSILKASHEKEVFNGVVLVADSGRVIYKKGFGVNDNMAQSPIKVGDRFYIGSMTKQFTSLLIYRLYEQGKLDINHSMTKYLPQFRGRLYKNITIHHLLTHTSGIASYHTLTYFDKTKDYPSDQMIKMIKARQPVFEAGTSYEYSNSGYYLLGKIIERCTKKSYGEVLKQEILIPLGMSNTAYETTWLDDHVAKGYHMTVDGMADMPKYSLSTLYASGGMYSTVDDLYKWNEALYSDRLLSDSLKYIMFTPNQGDYASGWRVSRGIEDEVYYERHQHGGTIQGYHTFILRRIPQQQTVIVLDNFYNSEVQSIKNSIWSILEGREGWIPKSMLSSLLYKRIVEGKLTTSLEAILANKSTYEYDYDFEEYNINTVGYRLMELNRLDEAKQIFEFNLALFPDSWNVYDSLGEVYFRLGRLGDASEMYQQSLRLNPKNESATNAIRSIKKLKKKVR